MSEPTAIRFIVPEEMGECEVIATFMAYPRGASIDANSGEPKIQLGIPLEDKYAALAMTDRGGETFLVAVIARKNPLIQLPTEE